MPNQSLVDLTERTATADSDLIHVNSGGSDYKETKRNFFKGSFGIEFTSDSLLTSQIDALPATRAFEYTGIIIGNGHQTETGLPEAQVFYVTARCYASTSKIIEIVKASDPNDRYVCVRTSGGWGSWTQLPARSEITSLNNSLTNSFTMVELMRQLNVPTSDTSYSCDWANYRVLVIAHVFYGNVMSTIVESREHMMISNSGNRVIASTPSNDVQWSVWKNGDNAVWVRASSANAQNGIAIFGLGKIS